MLQPCVKFDLIGQLAWSLLRYIGYVFYFFLKQPKPIVVLEKSQIFEFVK